MRPEWATDDVLDLLRTMLTGGHDPMAGPMLADALQEAGCDESCGPFVCRSLWLLRSIDPSNVRCAEVHRIAQRAGLLTWVGAPEWRWVMTDPRLAAGCE